MNLTLGFSPCPNDTFIFYAMIHNRIKTDIRYQVVMLDVEQLNRKAFKAELDITKLSFNAYGHLSENYQILDSGSALGRGCGPLLISGSPIEQTEIESQKIYIPGKYTTANLLLSIAYPKATNKTEVLFSDIENKLLHDPSALGLIIHENRFTYQEKGLHKIMDLGEYWEQLTHLPIPLGCITAKRILPKDVKDQIDSNILQSILYAYDHEDEVLSYCKQYAQEMDIDVMKAHIKLYVNEFSRSLGLPGKDAIRRLYKEMEKLNMGSLINSDIFYK